MVPFRFSLFGLALGLLLFVACDVEIEGDAAGECDDGVDNDQDGASDCADDGCAAATACAGGDDDDDDITPASVQLSGAVEKGPFVIGTTVNVSTVDVLGTLTGDVFSVATVNDLGEFNVDFPASGYVSLEGTGYYYNEITGSLSTGPLTLRAFHDVGAGGPQSAYLNLITHLSYARAKFLVANGQDFGSAIVQAEEEVRRAIGIGGDGYNPGVSGTELNILGGATEANAYLFAVSAVVAQAAATTAGDDGPVDATLQELINNISLDLETDGLLDSETAQALLSAQTEIDPSEVTSQLSERLLAIGSLAQVPDLNLFIDTDQDGKANSVDPDDDNDGVADSSDINPYDPSLTDVSWCDPNTSLCWQHTPNTTPMSPADAEVYCSSLPIPFDKSGVFRLPTISELRTLVQGSPDTEVGGACAVEDGCEQSCWSGECYGNMMDPLGGPGVPFGCYWAPELAGECEGYPHLSSSPVVGANVDAAAFGGEILWLINFADGNILYAETIELDVDDQPLPAHEFRVRCVYEMEDE